MSEQAVCVWSISSMTDVLYTKFGLSSDIMKSTSILWHQKVATSQLEDNTISRWRASEAICPNNLISYQAPLHSSCFSYTHCFSILQWSKLLPISAHLYTVLLFFPLFDWVNSHLCFIGIITASCSLHWSQPGHTSLP